MSFRNLGGSNRVAQKTGVDYALELFGAGLNVVPAPAREKLPKIKWRDYQSERVAERQVRAWFSGARRNYFVITGRISGICVLDCDSEFAESMWREMLGAVLDATSRVKTPKGHHFYFRLPEGVGEIRGRSVHDGAISYDFRCEGGGVIAPPSIHETGVEYTWVPQRGLDCLAEAPVALLRPEKASEKPRGASGRSMLVKLLSEPPVGSESGRNDWLARVGGHLVAGVRFEDGLLAALRTINAGLSNPLPDVELVKMAPSLLAAEARRSEDKELSERNGWLKSGGGEILVQVAEKKGDETQMGLAPFMNCDLIAKGVSAQSGVATYDVEIVRREGGVDRGGEALERESALLPAEVLAEDRALNKWLSGYRVGILAPMGAFPKAPNHERVRRYLEAQNPTEFEIIPYLGWCPEGFLCHEGVITAEGLKQSDRYRLDPRRGRDLAPFRYGFGNGGIKAAIEVLREVLTFHDETVCAVFGAWWAACFLKPQISPAYSGLFPVMGLQAPSEAGKTTGFFSLMLQLAGNTEGQSVSTMAAFRDAVGAHQSGIAWTDDKDDPRVLHEIIRAATGATAMKKKGEDRTSQVIARMVAPICISGETLGLGSQKALLDRIVSLEVPNPTSRKSMRESNGKGEAGRLQWLDILEFKQEHPDLTDYAGSLVQVFLGLADWAARVPSLIPEAAGRFGEKIAICRLGGQLLSEVLQEDTWAARVDAWAAKQVGLGSENVLTLKLLPMCLQHTNWKEHPEPAEGRWPATPAVVRQGEVWFNPGQLAQWWSVMQNGRVEERVESAEALTEQARALGIGGRREIDRRQIKHVGSGGGRSVYRRVDRELSGYILARSRGEDPQAGVHPQQHAEQLWDASRPPEEQL